MKTTSFDKFVNRPVKIVESKRSMPARPNLELEAREWVEQNYDPEDPTIVEIQEQAKSEGLRCRIWTPHTRGTMDFRADRINVHLEDVGQGFFQVTRVRIG